MGVRGGGADKVEWLHNSLHSRTHFLGLDGRGTSHPFLCVHYLAYLALSFSPALPIGPIAPGLRDASMSVPVEEKYFIACLRHVPICFA